jgi:acyl carrier protein
MVLEQYENIELENQILDIIARDGMIDRALLKPDATLQDLGVKSMDVVIILMGLEEKFDIYIPVDGPISAAKDVRGFVASLIDAIQRDKKA